MALQPGALRDVLGEANTLPDLVRRAVEEVAGYEHRFTGVEQKIDALDHRLERQISALDRKIDKRVNGLDRRIDALDSKMEQRFGTVDVRLAVLDGRLDKQFWAVSTTGALTVLTLGKVWFG